MGKGTNTTNTVTNSQPPAYVQQAYQDLQSKAQQVTNQPLEQYGGPLVAGFTPQQQQAFQTIQNSQGIATPFINAASGFATNAGAPINLQQFSPDAVSQYLSPYTQNVVDTTQAQFNNQNAQQASALKGQAAAAGALGGDRAGVAQAALAGQQQLAQAPVIANLYNQGYSQALGEFNQQQAQDAQAQEASGQLGLGAASALSGLGTQAQQTALTGASAGLQAGGLQQQLAQEQLNIPYEQFLQQQAYPYQNLQALEGAVTGIGSLAGGTSNTSSTQPSPSPISQVLGLGLSFLPFLKHGGHVRNGFASGGALPDVPDINVNFVNPNGTSQMAHGSGPPAPPPPTPQAQQQPIMDPFGASDVIGAIKKLTSQGQSASFKPWDSEGTASFGESGFPGVDFSDLDLSMPSLASGGSSGAGGSVMPQWYQDITAPQISMDTFAAPTGLEAGGGLPGWFNPLPQYKPPGTGANNVMPHYTIGTNGFDTRTAQPTGLGTTPTETGTGTPGTGATGGLGGGISGIGPKGQNGGGLLSALVNRVNTSRKDGGRAHYDDGGVLYPTDDGSIPFSLDNLPMGATALSPAATPDAWKGLVTNYGPSQSNGFATQASDDSEGDQQPVPDDSQAVLSGQQSVSDQPQPDNAGMAAQAGTGQGFDYVPPKPDWHNALATAGLAIAAGTSPNALTNIARGAQTGMQAYEQALHLDDKPVVDNSGPTTRIYYPSEHRWIDTGLPTEASLNRQTQAQYHQDELEERKQYHQDLIDQRRDAQTENAANRRTQLQIAQMNADAGRYSMQPGMGPDANDPTKMVPGAWVMNARTGKSEFQPGVVLTPKTGNAGGTLDPATIDRIATQVINGDPHALQGLGYGNAGAQNRALVQDAITKQATSMGVPPQKIAQMQATFQKGAQAFATGTEGKAIRSFNVGLTHLETLENLGKALDNGNVQVVNAAKNAFAQQFGGTAPTDFNAAKSIVGDEIVKAIVGGGGALADREKAQETINAANSWPQLEGVIKTYKTLMAGQLHGLQQQYEATTGLKDFNSRLSPAAQKVYATYGPQGPNTGSGGFVNGQIYKDANGNRRLYQNGQWAPVQ